MAEILQLVFFLLVATTAAGIAVGNRIAPYRAWLEAPLEVDESRASHQPLRR